MDGVISVLASKAEKFHSRRRRCRSPKQKVYILADVQCAVDRRTGLRIRPISISIVHAVKNIFPGVVFRTNPKQRCGSYIQQGHIQTLKG